MAIGYLVMLVAMMYSFELFFCTIVGLALGNLLFNSSAPPAESVTACCAGRNMTTTNVHEGTTALERILRDKEGGAGAGVIVNRIGTEAGNNIILHCGGASCECIDETVPPDTTVVTTANAFQIKNRANSS